MSDPERITESDVHPVSRGIDDDDLEDRDLDESGPDYGSEPQNDEVVISCPKCGEKCLTWRATHVPTDSPIFPRPGDAFADQRVLPCGHHVERTHTYRLDGWSSGFWKEKEIRE